MLMPELTGGVGFENKRRLQVGVVVARGWCSQRPPHHAVARFQEQAVWGRMILFLTSTDIHRYKKTPKLFEAKVI